MNKLNITNEIREFYSKNKKLHTIVKKYLKNVNRQQCIYFIQDVLSNYVNPLTLINNTYNDNKHLFIKNNTPDNKIIYTWNYSDNGTLHLDIYNEITNKINELETKKEDLNEIEIPQDGVLNSTFAKECCDILIDRNVNIFYKTTENKIVEVDQIIEKQKVEENIKIIKYVGFKTINPNRMLNIIEDNMITGYTKHNRKTGEILFIEKSTNANIILNVLENDCWKQELRHIQRILDVPIPVLYKGKLTFFKKEYDERFNTWVLPNEIKIDENISLEKAKEKINEIYDDFCFKTNQDKTNAIANLLTPFCQGLYNEFNTRTPIFFYEANQSKAGKDYCANIVGLIYEGTIIENGPISYINKKSDDDELRKQITTFIRNGRTRFHSSNNTGHINNAVLESLATNPVWIDRILGSNTSINLPNELFISMSANTGYTSTRDFENRCRFIILHSNDEDPTTHKYKNINLHEDIKRDRSYILSCLYTFVREWYKKGMPKGKTLFNSFPNWAEIVGGIMVCNNLGDPCLSQGINHVPANKDVVDTRLFCELMYECFGDRKITKKEMLDQLAILITDDGHDIFSKINFNKNLDGSWEDRGTPNKFDRLLKTKININYNIDKITETYDIKIVEDKTYGIRRANDLYQFVKTNQKKVEYITQEE